MNFLFCVVVRLFANNSSPHVGKFELAIICEFVNDQSQLFDNVFQTVNFVQSTIEMVPFIPICSSRGIRNISIFPGVLS